MKRYIAKILLFTLVFLIADRGFSYLVGSYVSLIRYDQRLHGLIVQPNVDVLILGSSRAARNVNAKQISECTDLKAVNIGQPGSNIEYHAFIFEFLLMNRVKPTILVYVVDPQVFSRDANLVFRTDKLYSYVMYEEIESELVTRGEINKTLVLALDSYKYKKNFPDALFGGRKPGKLDSIRMDGSMLLPMQSKRFRIDSSPVKLEYDLANPNDTLVTAYKDMISNARQNGIKVVLAVAPSYQDPHVLAYTNIIELSKGYVDVVWQYDEHNYKDKSLFYDNGHLNEEGAHLYTNELIEQLSIL